MSMCRRGSTAGKRGVVVTFALDFFGGNGDPDDGEDDTHYYCHCHGPRPLVIAWFFIGFVHGCFSLAYFERRVNKIDGRRAAWHFPKHI